MSKLTEWAGWLTAISLAAAASGYATHAQARIADSSAQASSAKQVRVAFTQALPQLEGGHLQATVVEVTYGPGASSAPHSHPCPVIVYVVKGTLRAKVKGEPEAVYHAGQSFYEAPNGVHEISANASKREPAKFVAYFVCDHDTELSVPPPSAQPSGGK
ncbi:MAG: cupin domain-containing protein [Candidatus Acidiferrales bacterium]